MKTNEKTDMFAREVYLYNNMIGRDSHKSRPTGSLSRAVVI